MNFRDYLMIELQNVRKLFGSLVAVDGIDLTVYRGELFALLGPNAAGKTTTIRMITGLIRPTSGTVRVCGFDVVKQPLEAKKRLAYVPDFPFLYEKLTPWEFFEFIGMLYQIPQAELRRRVDQWVQCFGLEPYLGELIEALSHGTRQRVAIVAGLIHEPEVFVLDEPTVGLDPHYSKVLKDILRQGVAAGMTVFLSTHQLSLAEEIADRVGIMHKGRLLAVGKPSELRQQAGMSGPLEEVFLRITKEEAEQDK